MSNTSYYAGIEKRFVAILIDAIFLYFVYFIAFGKVLTTLDNPKAIMYNLLTIIIGWIYFAGMESSSLQGTYGKRVLGIIVTDTNGNKISFGRATGRYFAKSICLFFSLIVVLLIALMTESTGRDNSPYWGVAGLVLIIGGLLSVIGYVMAAFTPEKQALHDIIARCLVVNGKSQSGSIPWKLFIVLAVAVIGGRVVLAQISEPTSTDTTRTETRTGETSPPTDNSNTSTSTSETRTGETSPPTDNSNTSTSTTETPSSETSQRTENLNSSPLLALNSTPEPSSTLNQNIPKSGKFTICGSEERLIEPGNLNIDGDWRLQFSGGGSPHIARLRMQGDSGIMRVVFPDSSGNGGKVDQTMQLYNSSEGLVLLGFYPTNPDTGERVTSYHADNFLIKKEFDGSITVTNCDDGGNRSPVKGEPFTNIQ
jgi:uncharacterized RDD family membrane protein YckC